MTAFPKIIFVFGMGLMLVAPLLLRRRWASPALAGGASIILVLSAFGLAYIDPKYDPAANQSDRRYYLLFLALELSVLALALISLRTFKWAFWLGWAINLALSILSGGDPNMARILLALVMRALPD